MLVDPGHRSRRPAHQVLHHARVLARLEQLGRVPVAKVMHPVPGQAEAGQQVLPVLPVALGVHRLAARPGEHQAADVSDGLVFPVRFQRSDSHGGQRDRPPGLHGFRLSVHPFAVDPLLRLPDAHSRRIGQLHVTPSQAESLALPQARRDGQHPAGAVRPAGACGQHEVRLLRRRRLRRLAVSVRRRHQRARVIGDPLAAHGVIQAGAENPVRRVDGRRRDGTPAALPRPCQQRRMPVLDVLDREIGQQDLPEVRRDEVFALLPVAAMPRVRVKPLSRGVMTPVQNPVGCGCLAPAREGEAPAAAVEKCGPLPDRRLRGGTGELAPVPFPVLPAQVSNCYPLPAVLAVIDAPLAFLPPAWHWPSAPPSPPGTPPPPG